MPRGLYIHIPFCFQKCHYCNFVITTNRSQNMRRRFFQALEAEIQHTVSQYGRLGFDTLYLGGGTPSLLDTREMIFLFNLFHRSFDIKKKELTCEMNPDDLDVKKLETYHALGINRISLGAQAFQNHLLRSMNRSHSANDIHTSIKAFHAAGFHNISLDLIIRLPHQTLKDVQDSLKAAVNLNVNQITIYDLEIHDKTVFGVKRRKQQLTLPDEETHQKMFECVEQFLTRHHYLHYELLSF